jgi:hypothetical protein
VTSIFVVSRVFQSRFLAYYTTFILYNHSWDMKHSRLARIDLTIMYR